jgi:hypothetical protein
MNFYCLLFVIAKMVYRTPKYFKARKNIERRLIDLENFLCGRLLICTCGKTPDHLPGCETSKSIRTHNGLTGGVFSIARDDHAKLGYLLEEVKKCKERGEKPHPSVARYDCLCETISDKKDSEYFFMFVDLDFELNYRLKEQDALKIGQQFVELLKKQILKVLVNPDLNYVMSFRTKPKNGKFKNGFHIVFPELPVNSDHALLYRKMTMDNWDNIEWIDENLRNSPEAFDQAVYNSGLRMNLSSKASKLKPQERLVELREIQFYYPEVKREPWYKIDDTLYKIIYKTKTEYNDTTSIKLIYKGDTSLPPPSVIRPKFTEEGNNLLEKFILSKPKSLKRSLTEEELKWEKQNNFISMIMNKFKDIGGYEDYKIKENCIEQRIDYSGLSKTSRKIIVEASPTGEHCGFCGRIHETPSFIILAYEKDLDIVCSRNIGKSHCYPMNPMDKVIYDNGLTFYPPGYSRTWDYWNVLLADNKIGDDIKYEIMKSTEKILERIPKYLHESIVRRIYGIFASYGRGKTSNLVEWLQEAINSGAERIIALSGLRSVATKFSKELTLKNYMEHDYSEGLSFDEDKLVCSIESLWKVAKDKPFDVLILDEIVFLLGRFASSTVKETKLRQVSSLFENTL